MFDQSMGQHIVQVLLYIGIGGAVILFSTIGAILIGDELRNNIKTRS